MKALDLGAYGITVPLVNTAEEAGMAVAACRYPPVGMHSSGPVRAVHYGGADYMAHANNEIVVMAMIETKEGLANLDAICATPGLDAVYIEPADLSLALGPAPRGDNPDPLHLATCDKILEAAHKYDIKCVMHCASAAFAVGAVKHGFDMVILTSDLSCTIAGARLQLDELSPRRPEVAPGICTRVATLWYFPIAGPGPCNRVPQSSPNSTGQGSQRRVGSRASALFRRAYVQRHRFVEHLLHQKPLRHRDTRASGSG